jgi:hypothetical protein
MARPEPILILNDAHGINLPRAFTTNVARERVEHVSDEDWAILQAGPDHREYWDAWADVCDKAVLTDDKGEKYFVNQDGDCWLIPVGMTWDEEADAWRWP